MKRHCSVCHLPGHTKASHRKRKNPQFRMTASGTRYAVRGTTGPGGQYNSLKTKKPPFPTVLRYLGDAKAKELYPRRYAAHLKSVERSKKGDEIMAAERGRKYAEQEARRAIKRADSARRSKRDAEERKRAMKA